MKSQTHKCVKTLIENSGAIRNTPLQQTLKLKVGAKIMLTYNIDTSDSLTNGAFGEILGFNFDNCGNIATVYVQFYDEKCGQEKRKNHTELQRKYPNKHVTPLKKIEFPYCMSKKQSKHNTATVLQFPIKLAFAATAHKIQGQTIRKPNSLIVDLRKVRQAAQAYVILSRVQALSQIFILVDVCSEKIYSSADALQELKRQRSLAINYKRANPSIVSCNIRSLAKHHKDIFSSSFIKQAEVICLQETWLREDTTYENEVDVGVMEKHFVSVGPGKGIATYWMKDFTLSSSVKKSYYQMTKVSSQVIDVINIYRSSNNEDSSSFLEDLLYLFNKEKETIILGDLNICYITERSHEILKAIERHGFQQKVRVPTHTDGHQMDHVLHYLPPGEHITSIQTVTQFGQYFTDHDLLLVNLCKVKTMIFNAFI